MAAPRALRAASAALLLFTVNASAVVESSRILGANPIRKVVTLMQNMQKEIEAEGEKEKELFEKFMCYCQNNGGDLSKSIADAKAKASELAAKLKAEEAEKSSTAQELIDHKKDREAATKDLAEATAIREKEKAESEETTTDMQTNIDAMAGAIPALEKGMGASSLLQTKNGDRLGRMVDSFPFTNEDDRKNLEAFLQQGTDDEASQDYVPQSDQIVGILKMMKEEVEANLAEAIKTEEGAVASFTSLKGSKEQEIAVASKAIETKQVRAGELAVALVQTKDDLEDTEKEAVDTEKFAAELSSQCGTKEKEWAEREKLRNEEITAISEAIAILNDDDALDVFKKAVPAALVQQAQLGFLQRSGTQASTMRKAQAILEHVAGRSSHKSIMKLMLFSLSSKLKYHAKHRETFTALKFEEVTKMVDDMVTIEGKEQTEDDHQFPWCNGEFDKSANEDKNEKSEIAVLSATVDEEQDQIADLKEAIKTLTGEIAELDKAVAEATEQRKFEHEDYLDALQLTQTALGLVEKAKNRMNKFYNPTQYKEAPSFVQLRVETFAHRGSRVAPPPAPETFGDYEKKSGKSSGVIALMDEIIEELENDTKNAEYEEKTAQKDYEELMTESKETRSEKMKGITDKEAAKAQISAKKQIVQEKLKGDFQDVDSIAEYVGNLHKECDFILQNYETRKDSRHQEVEGLKNAKAMLAGAIM
jgi:hypothetical protein